MDKIIFFSALTADSSATNSVMELPSVGALFFRIILSLFLIIFIVYFILRIINQQQKLRDNQRKWIKILDYQPLGPNRGLYLMELDDLTCIVAVSDGQISILKQIKTDSPKWKEIKENLQEIENIMPFRIGRFFKEGFPLRKNGDELKHERFQQQLAEQLRKSQHLSHEIIKGGDRDE
ncbi:MAG: flagellar biosynthetic protein FliO [Peptococcia bacterium]|jgi:flagellar biosynthetic protein FliO